MHISQFNKIFFYTQRSQYEAIVKECKPKFSILGEYVQQSQDVISECLRSMD